MASQVHIRIVGKKNGRNRWEDDAFTTYEKRLRTSNIAMMTSWHKNDNDLVKRVEADVAKGYLVVLLDPDGVSMSSEKFCEKLYAWLEEGGSRLVFVIGGAEGLPTQLRQLWVGRRDCVLSLSQLTFTHQMARVLLVEQIYRAAEIRKGTGYHK